MQLFYEEKYRGMTLKYWVPQKSDEEDMNIVASVGNQFKGEIKFKMLNTEKDQFYVATFTDILKSGRDLVDSLLNPQK
jgi:hypothetical protein